MFRTISGREADARKKKRIFFFLSLDGEMRPATIGGNKGKKGLRMNEIFQQYLNIWRQYYSRAEFGGTSIEVAAQYAASDCVNAGKRAGWSEPEWNDDIAYWKSKVAK